MKVRISHGRGRDVTPGAPATPVNTTAPVASGTPNAGHALSTTNGTWANSPTSYAYQWLRGGSAISGATSSSYTAQEDDNGNQVSCRVTATNSAGSASAISNSITIVQLAPVNDVAPTIAGTGTEGNTLSLSSVGTWEGAPTAFTYQWKRGGSAVTGETGSSYVLTSSDVGSSITVTVTATNAAGGVSATSNAIGPIVAAASQATGGTIAFDDGWTTGQNPPSIRITLPDDGSVEIGDQYRFEYADNAAFVGSTFTPWHEITSDDVLNSAEGSGFDFSWGGDLESGLTYFRLFFGRGDVTVSDASNTLSDTLHATDASALLDDVTSTRFASTLTFAASKKTITGAAINGAQCAGATVAAGSDNFQFEFTINVFGGSFLYAGCYNNTTNLHAAYIAPGRNDSNGYCFEFANGTGVNLYLASTLSQTWSVAYASGDIFSVVTDVSGGSVKLYKNNSLVASKTGLTLTGFNRAFLGVRTSDTLTFNPGNTFTHALDTGVTQYG